MAASPPAFDHKAFLATQHHHPGVYQMYAEGGAILYVGKAKSLKNRLASYFRSSGLAPKTAALVARIVHIETIVTNTEAEALILEQNLIKNHRPPYNILLRDDKSYPYVFIAPGGGFPRLGFYRGRKKRGVEYFGPYPSAGAIRESMNILQRVFRVRQCEDSYFRNRTRPCLQYQIKRCKAPCTGLVSEQEYATDVERSRLFLRGKSQALIYLLLEEMEAAAAALEFEKAADLRDQVTQLRAAQEQQVVDRDGGNIDVIAMAEQGDHLCFALLSIRGGRVAGNRSIFHQRKTDDPLEDIYSGLLAQLYLGDQGGRDVPEEVVTDIDIQSSELLQETISSGVGRALVIRHRVRGDRASWINLAQKNAVQNLQARLSNRTSIRQRYIELQQLLELDKIPARMECFDISHSSGEATVASCVVFNDEGPLKSDYRRFNITDITPGDDYAAMRQALHRRYSRVLKEEGRLPDLLFIDGGKGQLSMANQVMEELELTDLLLVGVAKGETRKPGLETLIVNGSFEEIQLPRGSSALLLIQSIRDEAHRFAITGHRQRRAKARNRSALEDVPGIGAKRRQQLLKYFGGLQGVSQASVSELQKVQGISAHLAEAIHDALHPD
ncbi:excinuclease ABC subunit UvrC [Aestuariirhabdus sp. Z084]|uniref:excinuclease ABC subunit UvrC n=1 Tax=Aestuariirhabdus haliotis TaxID=2918751 RepID=UPI00201B41CD|nr:excinuclease ABC subunit UvrC [Aestuariirhabdus haliotis]MCL6414827.1 excinuclease ABC subunit UvrC [Aestuariirhabdus haliotis]MCL6418759.1 excinuclease ABC subunit UvrC [Aestuariirhabdus haliotis]